MSQTQVTKAEKSSFDTLNPEELVLEVDENNQPIGPKPRKLIRGENLIHRSTYNFIKNFDGFYAVQKRSSKKDYCPNFYDCTPGGVINYGENINECNKRELFEEMGIKVDESYIQSNLESVENNVAEAVNNNNADAKYKYKFIDTFYYQDSRTKTFGYLFEVITDQINFVLQEEEVSEVIFLTLQEILNQRNADNQEIKITDDAIFAARLYFEEALGGIFPEVNIDKRPPTLVI